MGHCTQEVRSHSLWNQINRGGGQLHLLKKHILNIWLVVSTHLKNISQNGNLPQIGMKKRNTYLKPPPSHTLNIVCQHTTLRTVLKVTKYNHPANHHSLTSTNQPTSPRNTSIGVWPSAMADTGLTSGLEGSYDNVLYIKEVRLDQSS